MSPVATIELVAGLPTQYAASGCLGLRTLTVAFEQADLTRAREAFHRAGAGAQ
jgi:hypothetical protein